MGVCGLNSLQLLSLLQQIDEVPTDCMFLQIQSAGLTPGGSFVLTVQLLLFDLFADKHIQTSLGIDQHSAQSAQLTETPAVH